MLRHLLSSSAPIHTSKLLVSRDEALRYPRGRIELALCEACGLITNTAFDAPGHDYSASYEETQAFSARFQLYARRLAEDLASNHDLADTDVLEIGCGRADFLLVLCDVAGCRGIGVDASFREERLEGAAADRVDVERAFFDSTHVDRPFSLVVCRHTLEHVHDVHGFLLRLRRGLETAGSASVFFEVPDTARILREGAFWDVYYEHCTYFTPGSMARAFRCAGFQPTRLELGFDDQYVLITAVPGSREETLPLEESAADIGRLADGFVGDLEAARSTWTRRLRDAKARGRTSVVWGAGSKGVGFLATLQLDDEIACVVDVNPAKHGMFMPGSGHEIVRPGHLVAVDPDLVVVMNPAYADEIRTALASLGVAAHVMPL